MSNMDFDAIENYKFWKSVISLIIGGIIGVITLLVLSDGVETRNMIAAGYEYRRVVAQRTVSYTYQWVKIGSPESREEVSDTVPGEYAAMSNYTERELELMRIISKKDDRICQLEAHLRATHNELASERTRVESRNQHITELKEQIERLKFTQGALEQARQEDRDKIAQLVQEQGARELSVSQIMVQLNRLMTMGLRLTALDATKPSPPPDVKCHVCGEVMRPLYYFDSVEPREWVCLKGCSSRAVLVTRNSVPGGGA